MDDGSSVFVQRWSFLGDGGDNVHPDKLCRDLQYSTVLYPGFNVKRHMYNLILLKLEVSNVPTLWNDWT